MKRLLGMVVVLAAVLTLTTGKANATYDVNLVAINRLNVQVEDGEVPTWCGDDWNRKAVILDIICNWYEAEYEKRAVERFLAEAAAQVALWQPLANCETGGNWAMQGSRFSGGVGFYNGTWDAYGGRQYAPNAGMANAWEQTEIAKKVARDHGPSSRPWDSCTVRVPYHSL